MPDIDDFNGYCEGMIVQSLQSKLRESSIFTVLNMPRSTYRVSASVLMKTDLLSSPHFYPASHFLFSHLSL